MFQYIVSLTTLSFCLCCNQSFCADNSLCFDIFFEKTSPPTGNSRPNFNSIFINKNGDIVFVEKESNYKSNIVFWTQHTGVEVIDIHKDLLYFGYETKTTPPDLKTFDLYPLHFDDSGNVFFKFLHKDPKSPSTSDKMLGGICVWNKKYGVKIIELPGIHSASLVEISGNRIVVTGVDDSLRSRIVILQCPKDLWDSKTENNDQEGNVCSIDTPWENMPLGDLGARLYVIEKIFKHPKSKKERKYITHVVESEAAHVLDSLQYRAKKAKYLIYKSAQEGQENPLAEEEYEAAMIGMDELCKMLKKMPISNTKVFSLDLPSASWEPTER